MEGLDTSKNSALTMEFLERKIRKKDDPKSRKKQNEEQNHTVVEGNFSITAISAAPDDKVRVVCAKYDFVAILNLFSLQNRRIEFIFKG